MEPDKPVDEERDGLWLGFLPPLPLPGLPVFVPLMGQLTRDARPPFWKGWAGSHEPGAAAAGGLPSGGASSGGDAAESAAPAAVAAALPVVPLLAVAAAPRPADGDDAERTTAS